MHSLLWSFSKHVMDQISHGDLHTFTITTSPNHLVGWNVILLFRKKSTSKIIFLRVQLNMNIAVSYSFKKKFIKLLNWRFCLETNLKTNWSWTSPGVTGAHKISVWDTDKTRPSFKIISIYPLVLGDKKISRYVIYRDNSKSL